MKITFFGTTTLLFDDGKDQILFDAHLTRPSLYRVLCGTLSSDTGFIDSILHKYDFGRLRSIFISHSHYDHVLDAPYLAKQLGADLYGSQSTLQVGRGGGLPEKQLHLFVGEDRFEIGAFRIRVLTSVHSEAKWYNNDLGKTIDQPLVQPARKKDFKEGGSFDFLIENGGKSYLIRPSYNYLEGELNDVHADVLFLGIAGISGSPDEKKECFFQETIEKVKPSLVIPIHWDNFFSPLDKPVRDNYVPSERQRKMLYELTEYCSAHEISCTVLMPKSFVNLTH